MKELKTWGVYRLTVSDGGGKPELLVSVKQEHQQKPLYQKALQRQFEKNRDVVHPNMLKYVGTREVEGLGLCLVLEWEDARPLSVYIAESHELEDKKAVVEQLAEALGFLHERKMIHGDLSSTVVFVTNKGNQVRLLNLRQQYSGNQDEAAQVVRYQAPEVKDGTVALTPRADMYALGMIMKDLRLGGEYYDVVSRCCSYNSSERFATMGDLVDALEHRRRAKPARARRSSARGMSKGVMRFLAIVLGLAVIVGVVVYFVGSTQLLQDEPAQAVVHEDTTAVTPQEAVPEQPETAVAPTGQYTGELEFLATLVPQMHIDIDKMYAPYSSASTDEEKKEVRAKAARYYRGLRKTLGKKSQAQFEAFDQAFATYVKAKNEALR